MEAPPVLYAQLRDQLHWEGASLAGLQAAPDGALTLLRVAGLPNGQVIAHPGPFAPEPSGVSAGACGDLYLSHTARHRVIWEDGLCRGARTALPGAGGAGSTPGQFNTPCGLLATGDRLYVADRRNSRVQVFRLPTLELSAVWEGPLVEPTALAADSQGRLYVLDRGLQTVVRFSAAGTQDTTYRPAMAQPPANAKPAFLAIDAGDRLFVTDQGSNSVLCFDVSGKSLGALPQGTGCPVQPRALAAHGSTLYVADAASGHIWVAVWMEEASAGIFVGTLAGYRGPVAALAVDESGALYIKPDEGETVHRLAAGAGYAPSGTLTAGPLDAGELSAWDRVHVAVDLPHGTSAELRLFTASSDKHAPDWPAAPRAAALDTRLIALPDLAALPHAARRFLWLHITLSSAEQPSSPILRQAQAQTAAESYLHYLPAVYRRDDAPTGFLERWLALFQAALSDVELQLADMPRRFDPATTPQEHLPWLAEWLGFELPPDQAPEKARALLSRVHALYRRRGTPGGLADFIELYAGVRPTIVEAFHERRVWQLGETSVLGFDTALPASEPDGLIIPGQTWADPNYMGLRGDYYDGLDFARLRLTRTDRTVNFDWSSASPAPTDTTFPVDFFSVRWTGQVMARHSEAYTFYVRSDDGVRLWVDGQPLIDAWVDQGATTHTGQIALTAGRWYALTLEYYEKAGAAVIQLAWSSRSQPKEIIPESQLYSVRDERAQLLAADLAGAEPMRVGHMVVGESGPLAAAEFGQPLSSETAHLFTVLVPAGQLPGPAQRQALTRTLEAEKPAHTDYHLCLVEARMRIGFQARLGVDAILAAAPAPMTLAGAALGLETYLGADDAQHAAGRVGQDARLGRDTMMG